MALLKDTEIYAPPLLGYELTSIARKKAMRYPELKEKILAALEIGLGLDISWTEVEHLEVLRLALDTGLTTYDASYLYLSRALKIPLTTFDEKLAEKARANGA